MHEKCRSPEFGTEIANCQHNPIERAVRPATYGEPGEFTIAPVVEHSGMQRNLNGFRVAPLRLGKDSFDPLNIGFVSGDGFQRALPIIYKEVVVRSGHVHGAEDDLFVRSDGILNHLVEFRDVRLPRERDGIATKTLVRRKEGLSNAGQAREPVSGEFADVTSFQ